MMNQKIKDQSTVRLAAVGRKASSDLIAGDKFHLESEAGVTFTFLRWTGAMFPGRQAMARRAMLRTHEGIVTPRVLNMAGSVKMSSI